MRPHWHWMTGMLLLLMVLSARAANKRDPFAPLLPSPAEFRLQLREDPQSKLPLGPSCGGEAAATLTCRAFVLTLTNVGTHIVRIDGSNCEEPRIRFSLFEIRAKPVFWFPITDLTPASQERIAKCDLHSPQNWTNTRLRPGEHIHLATRLMSPWRSSDAFQPGSHELRAEWTIWGCTDTSEADNCLTPLQSFSSPASSVPEIGIQTPVTIMSTPIVAVAPQLRDLGTPRFQLEVTTRLAVPVSGHARYDDCTAAVMGSIDCIVFHYSARYIGHRIIRNGHMSCSDDSFSVEYRQRDTDWNPLPGGLWACTLNIWTWQVLRPGEAIERDAQLAISNPYSSLSIDPLRKAGQYELRFTFHPDACIASPDGSFCLTRPTNQEDAVSPVVRITTTRDAPASRDLNMNDR